MYEIQILYNISAIVSAPPPQPIVNVSSKTATSISLLECSQCNGGDQFRGDLEGRPAATMAVGMGVAATMYSTWTIPLSMLSVSLSLMKLGALSANLSSFSLGTHIHVT